MNKSRKRRVFGPLFYCTLLLAIPVLVFRYWLGGYEGVKAYFEMRTLAHKIVDGGPASIHASQELLERSEAAQTWYVWLLKHRDPAVRRIAVQSLGNIRPMSLEALEGLQRLHDDPDPQVSKNALIVCIRGFEDLGAKQVDEGVRNRISAALEARWRSGDRSERNELAASLRLFPKQARALTPEIKAFLTDPKTAKEEVVAAMKGGPAALWRSDRPYHALTLLDPDAWEEVGLVFVDWLSCDDEELRAYAFSCLSAAPDDLPVQVEKKLVALLRDPHPAKRAWSAEVLFQGSKHRQEAGEASLRMILDSTVEFEIRNTIICRYLSYKPKTSVALSDGLVLQLGDRDPQVRAWAVRLFRRFINRNELPADELIELEHDPDPRVRHAFCEIARRFAIGDSCWDKLSKAIASLIEDPSEHVAMAACQTSISMHLDPIAVQTRLKALSNTKDLELRADVYELAKRCYPNLLSDVLVTETRSIEEQTDPVDLDDELPQR